MQLVPEFPLDGLCVAADSAAAQPKKPKRESRILRAVKRELEAERLQTQEQAPEAPTSSQAARGKLPQHDATQPEPSAMAAQGLPTSKNKPAKAKSSQRAASLGAEELQGSAPQRSGGAKAERKRAQSAVPTEPATGAEAWAEQPLKKGSKQGKQKGKKSKAPDPATGKLLEGAIAMLAARAPKHVKR